MLDSPYIKNVYAWQNGQTMVFDQHGSQMPQYQGRKEEVWEAIQRDKRPNTKIQEDCAWGNYTSSAVISS